jgi:hypothetical protein
MVLVTQEAEEGILVQSGPGKNHEMLCKKQTKKQKDWCIA